MMNFELEDASHDVYVWGLIVRSREMTLMLPPS